MYGYGYRIIEKTLLDFTGQSGLVIEVREFNQRPQTCSDWQLAVHVEYHYHMQLPCKGVIDTAAVLRLF
jgi:hypothetical protein